MEVLNFDNEILKAKQYLKESSTNGVTLYDHLSTLVEKILTERPKNPTDSLESYLKSIRGEKKTEAIEDDDVKTEFATKQLKLFEAIADPNVSDEENEDEPEIPTPNCIQQAFFFEQASVGLGREENYRIFLALKQLALSKPLASVRLWGKLFGTKKNYIIAETEFQEGEGEEELETTAEDENQDPQEEENGDDDEPLEPTEENNKPKSTWKPPPPIRNEPFRTGANKKVYFVCNEPGDTWVKLPHVFPDEIQTARLITKFFTGQLDAEVASYPPFPGNEANYLRAQIARISASTQISPAGFYVFDEDEEDDDDEVHETYMTNEDFEGLPLRDLTNANNWVHHSQYLLPQGRCSWNNPLDKSDEELEEDEDVEDEDENPLLNVIPEIGPSLLTSIADDLGVADQPAWSMHVSSRVIPEYAVAIARSNRWPGAMAFGQGTMYENIYIGWGQKYSHRCYNPPALPITSEEFAIEILEMEDPTVEDERALQERQNEAMKAADDMDNLEDDDEDD